MWLSLEEVVKDTSLRQSASEGYPDLNIGREEPGGSGKKLDFRDSNSMFLS